MSGNSSLGQETEQIHKGTVSPWMVAMETDPLCTDARREREEGEEVEGCYGGGACYVKVAFPIFLFV